MSDRNQHRPGRTRRRRALGVRVLAAIGIAIAGTAVARIGYGAVLSSDVATAGRHVAPLAEATDKASPSSASPSRAASSSPAPQVKRAKPSPPSAKTSGKTSAPTPPSSPTPPSAPSSCISLPSLCGFPDSTNTGVPAGIKLLTVPGQVSSGKGWHYDSRGWVEVTGNHAVLQNLYIPFNVDVSASYVTLKNLRIVVTGDDFGVGLRHTRGVTITNCDIYSPDATGAGRLMAGIKDIYADSSGLTVERNNIWHTSTGLQMDSGLIEDNYIHDMGYKPGDHLNGITSNAGNGRLVILHNTVLNSYSQTDAISLFQDFGVQSDRLIEGNFLAGGGYTIYGGGGSAVPSDIVIVGNVFSRQYYRAGGYYGPVAYFDKTGVGDQWTGNTWAITGRVIHP